MSLSDERATDSASSKELALAGVALSMLPLAFVARWLAFAFPLAVERLYGEMLYPRIVVVLRLVGASLPVSVAELIVMVMMVGGAVMLAIAFSRRREREGTSDSRRRWIRPALFLWAAAGVVAWAFLLLWGFNYARPSLADRMRLDVTEIDAEDVLALGERAARQAAQLRLELGGSADRPSALPMSFSVLNRGLDDAYRRLDLAGDTVSGPVSPAKRLWSSTLFSYLGIAGIFIPFTGEPSINALVPDPAVPMMVAHEKAHQRGITDEGEANLAAFLACAAADGRYARYAAFLDAAVRLIGAGQRADRDRARDAWELLGEGALTDLAAMRDFWAAYRSPATRMATGINDAYLRSNRVAGGVHSYGRAASMLVALDRQGRFP